MPYKDPTKHKDAIKLKNQIYSRTPRGIKSKRIRNWKFRGVIFSDYNLLYDIYMNTTHCDLCKVKLTDDILRTATTRCLDHDHNITDCENVRNILCHKCNTKRP